MSDSSFPRSRLPLGPLGFPMPDQAARALDGILRSLPGSPDHAYRHALLTRAPTELDPGERSDVSWISVECVDRMGEVVLARGMDDRQFRLNPLVTLGHDYTLPPVGQSLWRRRVHEGDVVGIKARTRYPTRPEAWPEGEPWLPDQVFALVQAGLLRGKSVGFLPVRVHVPDEQEVRRRGWTEDVRLVIDEWLLLEYACVSLPANQHALVEAVSKGAVRLGPEIRAALGLDRSIGFTTLTEIEGAVARRVEGLDLPGRIAREVRAGLDRARGRV